jgi:hypothetical protein
LQDLFSRKQINTDGLHWHSNEFLINAEFVAILDYYVAVSLSAKSSDAEWFRPYYRLRVKIDKSFDGTKEKHPDWRPQLQAVLKAWQKKFPAVIRKKRPQLSASAADHAEAGGADATEDDLRAAGC